MKIVVIGRVISWTLGRVGSPCPSLFPLLCFSPCGEIQLNKMYEVPLCPRHWVRCQEQKEEPKMVPAFQGIWPSGEIRNVLLAPCNGSTVDATGAERNGMKSLGGGKWVRCVSCFGLLFKEIHIYPITVLGSDIWNGLYWTKAKVLRIHSCLCQFLELHSLHSLALGPSFHL